MCIHLFHLDAYSIIMYSEPGMKVMFYIESYSDIYQNICYSIILTKAL